MLWINSVSIFGLSSTQRTYAAKSPNIADENDSRHVVIKDKQASFDQPDSSQLETLGNKDEFAPINGVLYLGRGERFNDSRRKVAAQVVRCFIHGYYDHCIEDLDRSTPYVSHDNRIVYFDTRVLGFGSLVVEERYAGSV